MGRHGVSSLCELKVTLSRKEERHRKVHGKDSARIAQGGFYCYTEDTLLRQAYSPLSRSTYCFKYALCLPGCVCLSRIASARFRDEPS